MIIQKPRVCLADNEDSVDHWGQSVFGNLENSGQTAAENVGLLFEVR